MSVNNQQLHLLPTTLSAPRTALVPLDALPATFLCDPPDAAFIASVAAYGVMQPIGLLERDEGDFAVAFGRRRILGARAAGLIDIPASIWPAGWVDPALLTLVENDQRKANPLSDLAAIELLRSKGASDKDIMLATGLRHQTIRARERLRALIPELRRSLELGRLKITSAEAAARLTPDQQRLLLGQLATGAKRLKLKDVHAARRVQTAAAVSVLPGELFRTPGASTEQPSRGSWAVHVDQQLEVLMAEVPADELTIHNQMRRLRERVAKAL